jgi:hypothetical protein
VSDVIYVLLTLAVFVMLSLLVGVLDRHSGEAAPQTATPETGASTAGPADALVADRGAR